MNFNQLTPQERVTHLWLTIFGVTGSNGLHGKVRDQERDLKDLDDRLSHYDTLEAQIRAMIRVGQWALMLVGTVLALLASGPVASFLWNIAQVGMKGQ